ncbi:MAG: class I SAM-dependent methyltransferase [Terracidiphilus sp.]|jgi:2-polyprenyl-3-methyl-5-hydroxy-6-metoxy-1,4-benzoquinol methylase
MESVKSCNVCKSDLIGKIDSDYNFCKCLDCGYVFDSPRPTPPEVTDFYSQPAKYDSWIHEERGRKALWRRRLRKMIRHSNPGNLLDVGAGIGQFLYHARHFFSPVEGTEVSASAVQIAKEKYGLDIHRGVLEELHLPPESYDNISLFHVLEHVHDPTCTILECRRLLRPNGKLVIAVPNDVLALSSIRNRTLSSFGMKRYRQFSPKLGLSRAGDAAEIHLSHFTPVVLRRLLEKNGFSIVRESLDPFYPSHGFKWVLQSIRYAVFRLLFAIWRSNHYETIWMVSEKVDLKLDETEQEA